MTDYPHHSTNKAVTVEMKGIRTCNGYPNGSATWELLLSACDTETENDRSIASWTAVSQPNVLVIGAPGHLRLFWFCTPDLCVPISVYLYALLKKCKGRVRARFGFNA